MDGGGPVDDPAAALRQLAGGLQAAYTADPGNAVLAREYRLTLLAIGGGEKADSDLAKFWAEFSGA